MSMTIIYVHDGIFLDFLIKINYSANQNVHILIKQKKNPLWRGKTETKTETNRGFMLYLMKKGTTNRRALM